jgi:general secretion pathway protein G
MQSQHGRKKGKGPMRTKRNLIVNGQRGISLIEIMVVLAIIGVVMGGVFFAAFPMLAKARCKNAHSEALIIQQAIGLYRNDNGDCPKALSELYAGKYVSKDPVDPWNSPFLFKCPGEQNPDSADVWSKGNDKNEGSADDVKGWLRVEAQCK